MPLEKHFFFLLPRVKNTSPDRRRSKSPQGLLRSPRAPLEKFPVTTLEVDSDLIASFRVICFFSSVAWSALIADRISTISSLGGSFTTTVFFRGMVLT
jgi:hypothetical protein